eukprot:COSAG06_NODE_71219_length_186_cov_123.229885_1_plen_23_part_10
MKNDAIEFAKTGSGQTQGNLNPV